MGLIHPLGWEEHNDRGMECIVCGGEAGGHRVVVATDASETRGGFCHSCESTIFGSCLEQFQTETEDGCIVCDSPGDYLFYDWLERVDADSEVDSSDLADRDSPAPPALCNTHFQALASDAVQWVPSAALDQTTSNQ